jgi:uncharacterized protein YbjT (DUF2867 family)
MMRSSCSRVVRSPSGTIVVKSGSYGYESEGFLKNTGVLHTILRDSFYSELAVQMFNEGGVMKGPGGEGRVSWVGREEIAEAAAKLLASDKPLLGTFPMTGPQLSASMRPLP